MAIKHYKTGEILIDELANTLLTATCKKNYEKISKVFVLIFFTGVNGDTIEDYFSLGHGLYCTGKILIYHVS
jgi:hypothetical protein